MFLPRVGELSTQWKVYKGILEIRDLTKIRCGNRERLKTESIRDLTATREAGKILALGA